VIRHTELALRDYQIECISAVWGAWPQGMQRPAVVLPTGAGKTVIFAHLTRDFLDIHRRIGDPHRVVILVHRDELADQAIAKIRSVAPDLAVGKVKADSDEIHCDVMVCSVQTLARGRRLDRLVAGQTSYGRVGLVIVDECHHAAAPSYLTILKELGCFTWDEVHGTCGTEYEGTRAVGFTATLARGDGVGLGNVWEDVVYTQTTLWMISRGYLVDVRGRTVDLELDLSQVKTSGGDYQAKSLGDALMQADGPRHIARAVQQHAADRRPIVFTPDVATAYTTAAELDRLGIACDVVEGNTTREERRDIYRRYRTGELTAIVNCMVLTEGADFPWADCAVIARPTKSAPLYIQMVGRVLRTWPGKTDALVLNVIGEGGTLSTLIDLDPGLITAPEPGQSLSEAYIAQEERANTTVSADHLAFELKYRDVDLFAASSHAWLRTRGGVMFLPRGDGEVFLWPERSGEGWMVGFAPVSGRAWEALHRELPLGMAMAWAETEAGSGAFTLSARDKRWRKEPAETRQISKARSIGITVEGPATKGEVSDAIAIVQATRRFDERMRSVER
jgi:superfamily II DNA or RNA helicase